MRTDKHGLRSFGLLKACRSLLVFSVLANLLMLATPLHMMQIYDRVLVSGSHETLIYITLITALALGFFGLAETLRGRLAQRVSAKFATDNADRLFERMTGTPLPGIGPDRLMHEFATLRAFIASRAMIGLFDLPFVPVFLALLFMLHVQIGLITTAGIVVLMLLALVNRRLTAPLQDIAGEAQSGIMGFASAVGRRAEDIRAMGLLPALGERFGTMMATSLNAHDTATARNAGFLGISRALRQILQVSIMAWGAALVLAGDMSGGVIFAASIISGRALQPIEQIIGGWEGIARAWNARQLLADALGADTSAIPVAQPRPVGRLAVSGLAFQAETDGPPVDILYGVRFRLEPGEALAVIGSSGAGKSTLARMIAGALAPTDGEVRLDGCAQQNWPADQWGSHVGYVGQEIMLFPGTIAENIARMAIAPDAEQVVRAARLAGAHDLINALPQGYATQIGAEGIRLSGGQTQRIALARALYTEPTLLVLDEPNAHLDREGELVLLKSLDRLKRAGTTIVLVTQRKRLLTAADWIMVVDKGRQKSLTRAGSATQDGFSRTRRGKSARPVARLNPSTTQNSENGAAGHSEAGTIEA